MIIASVMLRKDLMSLSPWMLVHRCCWFFRASLVRFISLPLHIDACDRASTDGEC